MIVVARDPVRVVELQPDIEGLLRRTQQEDDITGTPAYFLALVRAKRARPFVVAAYDGSHLAGIVYGLERCLFGVSAGVVECGDSCGDGSVFCEPERFDEIVNLAVNTFLGSNLTWLARVSWNTSTAEEKERIELQELPGKAISEEIRVNAWTDLCLERTYEQFIESLGSRTRRNMRYYRRRAEQKQWEFVSDVTPKDAAAAIESLYPHQGIGKKDQTELGRFQKRLEEVPGAFYSGLRNSDGAWIGIMGGWVRGTHLFILTQLNNAAYASASVSMVLRSYVIERAINAGIRHLRFIEGCEGTLKRYCRVRATHLLVHRKGYLSRISAPTARRLFPSSVLTLCFQANSPRRERAPKISLFRRFRTFGHSVLLFPAIKNRLAKYRLMVRLYPPYLFERTHPVDVEYGIATSGFVRVEEISADPRLKALINPYGGSQPSVVRRVLRALGEVGDYTFADLGCGKGRAVIVAGEFPFRAIMGIELSPDLVSIARANAETVAREFPQRTKIDIFQGNVVDFRFPDGNLVVFLYHSFGRELLSALIEKLEERLSSGLTHLFFVYYNPVHGDLLDASPELSRWYAESLQCDRSEAGYGPEGDDAVVVWQGGAGVRETPHRMAGRRIVVTKPLWRAELGSG